MKIIVSNSPPMGVVAFDEDRLDGAPDAGPRSQRQGWGKTREEALRELAAQACEDYTDAQLTMADAQALQAGDTTTLVFVTLMRELEAA